MTYLRNIVFLILCMFFVGASYGMTANEVYKKVGKSVVVILVFKNSDAKNAKENYLGHGSGVAVKHNIVATNCHVALKGKYIIIKQGKKYSRATIVVVNKPGDICLLRVHDITLVPVSVRPSADLASGDDIYAVGNPLDIENYLSKGMLSQVLNDNQGNTWVVSGIITAPGSSGGGLFDENGNLIAITTTAFKANPNISYSASVDWIIQKLGLQSVFKKNLPNRKPLIPQKAPKKTNGIQLIGQYGDSKIALYRFYKGGCFIYFPGRTASGLVTSAAIWFPGSRQLVFIYPSSKNLSHVIKMHQKNYNKSRMHDKEYKKTKHLLYLEKKGYNLYSHGKYNFQESILVTVFDEDPTMILVEGSHFTVYIADPNYKGGYRMRIFGLWGFSEALVNYNAKCLHKQ